MAVCGKIFRNRHFSCLQKHFCLINFFTWAGDSSRPATGSNDMYSVLYRPKDAGWRHVGDHVAMFNSLKEACRYAVKMNGDRSGPFYYWVA